MVAQAYKMYLTEEENFNNLLLSSGYQAHQLNEIRPIVIYKKDNNGSTEIILELSGSTAQKNKLPTITASFLPVKESVVYVKHKYTRVNPIDKQISYTVTDKEIRSEGNINSLFDLVQDKLKSVFGVGNAILPDLSSRFTSFKYGNNTVLLSLSDLHLGLFTDLKTVNVFVKMDVSDTLEKLIYLPSVENTEETLDIYNNTLSESLSFIKKPISFLSSIAQPEDLIFLIESSFKDLDRLRVFRDYLDYIADKNSLISLEDETIENLETLKVSLTIPTGLMTGTSSVWIKKTDVKTLYTQLEEKINLQLTSLENTSTLTKETIEENDYYVITVNRKYEIPNLEGVTTEFEELPLVLVNHPDRIIDQILSVFTQDTQAIFKTEVLNTSTDSDTGNAEFSYEFRAKNELLSRLFGSQIRLKIKFVSQ